MNALFRIVQEAFSPSSRIRKIPTQSVLFRWQVLLPENSPAMDLYGKVLHGLTVLATSKSEARARAKQAYNEVVFGNRKIDRLPAGTRVVLVKPDTKRD